MATFTKIEHSHLSLLTVLLTFHLITDNFHATGAQVVEPSDAGWISKDNFQYYVSKTAEETSSTWHGARDWCMTNSADLASILSLEENDFIISEVNVTGYQGFFWIGFNSLQSETWSWTDEEYVNYTNWEATFPVDNPVMPWKCGYSELTGLWKNAHCESRQGFVCKRPNDVVTTVKTDPATTPVPGYCPAGYFGVVNSNKCFRIVRLDVNANQGITWDDAAAICRAEPGISPDIGCIADLSENNAVVSHLEDQQDGLWIGLRNENSGGSYMWSDNSAYAFTNWSPGEPLGTTDHCVEMWMAPGPTGSWNNIPCDKKRGYVCQTFKDPAFVVSTPSLTTAHHCRDGYVPYWYACYKVYPAPLAWSDAEAQCIQDGGHLASIHSEPENAAVTFFMSAVASHYPLFWIGLEFLTNEGVYYWSDNWHVIYTKWAEGQPNRTVDGGGCVGIYHQGTWVDSICSEAMPFVCKITTETPNTTPPQMEGICPTNTTLLWFPYGEYCYGVSSNYLANNWDFAQQACVDAVPGRPCNLMSIHSSLEGQFAGDLVARYSYTVYETFWVGLRKAGINTSFTWIDNTEVEYTAWNPGEPNDVDGTQNCVRVYYKNFADTWDDYMCAASSSYFPFVCKVLKAPYPTTPPPPSNVSGVCPGADWTSYGGDCYLFRPDEYVTWDEADQDCKAFGSHLATIFNKDDNWLVHRRLFEASWFPFVRQFWIGLSKQQDGKYFWSDGLSLDDTNYTNWRSGNPSQNDTRLCVDLYGSSEEDVLNSGKWTTSQCDQLRGYACRVSKAPATQPPNSSSGGPDAGAIVGAVFGIIIGVGLIAGGSYFGYRWYKGRHTNTPTGAGVSNVAYDNSSQNGSSKRASTSDGEQRNYFGDLESQDPSSVRIGRLELND